MKGYASGKPKTSVKLVGGSISGDAPGHMRKRSGKSAATKAGTKKRGGRK